MKRVLGVIVILSALAGAYWLGTLSSSKGPGDASKNGSERETTTELTGPETGSSSVDDSTRESEPTGVDARESANAIEVNIVVRAADGAPVPNAEVFGPGGRSVGSTGATGEVAVRVPPESSTGDLHARATGFMVVLDAPYQRLAHGDTCRFIAHRAHFQPITIIDADGEPWVLPARIECELGASREHQGWTPELGGVWLRPGRQTLVARSGSLASQPERVQVSAGSAAPPVLLRLEALHSVELRVVQSAPVARDALVRWNEDGQPDVRTEFVPAGGRTTIEAVRPGIYRFAASRNWSRGAEVEQLVTVAGPTVVELELPEWAPELSCHVRVLDPTDEPLDNVQFALGRYGGGQKLESEYQFDGVYLVDLALRGEGDPTLQLQTSTHGVLRVPCPEPGSETEVRFPVTASLTLAVRGHEDLPPPLELRLVATGANEYLSKYLGDSGVIEFMHLQPNDYRVEFVLEGNAVIHSDVVRVLPGDNSAELTLPSLNRVIVRDLPSRRVTLRREDGRAAGRVVVLAEDDVAIVGLAPGMHLLEVGTGGSIEFMPIQVTDRPDEVFHYSGNAPNCQRVMIDPSRAGLLGRAGLRAGDLVLSADGGPWIRIPPEREIFARSGTESPVRLRVLRAGVVHEVALTRDTTGEVNSLGGSFEIWYDPAAQSSQ